MLKAIVSTESKVAYVMYVEGFSPINIEELPENFQEVAITYTGTRTVIAGSVAVNVLMCYDENETGYMLMIKAYDEATDRVVSQREAIAVLVANKLLS